MPKLSDAEQRAMIRVRLVLKENGVRLEPPVVRAIVEAVKQALEPHGIGGTDGAK